MRRFAPVLLLGILLAAGAGVRPLWAQEAETHAAQPASEHVAETHVGEPTLLQTLGIEWQLLVVNTVGFIVLLVLLWKFLYGPISHMLEERAARIRHDLEAAERNRREMEDLRSEYEQHLARIEQEARDRLQEAMRQAHAAREQLLDDTRGEAAHIRDMAMDEIRRERDKLRVELRDEVVDMAIAAAERIIERSLDAEAHRAIIDDLLERSLQDNGNA